jgi:hypothetical protein
VLYSFEKPTADLDIGLERYWRPRIVSQTRTDWDGDGKSDLLFYDYVDKTIRAGDQEVELPQWLRGEIAQLYVANLPGDGKVDFLMARLSDTYFHWGRRLAELIEQQRWQWTERKSDDGVWQPEYYRWLWDWDIPVIADLDDDGFDSVAAYRARTKQWLLAGENVVPGPTAEDEKGALPFAGRFLDGSAGDLGLWSFGTGTVFLQSASAPQRNTSFRWGGRPGDVLVPGDYDGDGRDEIGIWQRTNQTWYWKQVPDGPISQFKFGTQSGVPVPADFDHDGRLDPAYWEAAEGKIYVSLARGPAADLVLAVPPHSLPAFVNLL